MPPMHRTWESTFIRLAALLSGTAALASILAYLAGRPTMTAGLAAADLDRSELRPRADTIRFVNPPAGITAGRPAAWPVEVLVADREGHPVSGAAVEFGVSSGELSSARGVTGVQGIARTDWTPGPAAGRQILTATVIGGTARTRQAIQVTGTVPPR